MFFVVSIRTGLAVVVQQQVRSRTSPARATSSAGDHHKHWLGGYKGALFVEPLTCPAQDNLESVDCIQLSL